MPRIPVHTIDSAPPMVRPILRTLRNRHGKIFNLTGELAHSPAALAMQVGMEEALTAHATFDVKTREAVSLAVSAANDCIYSQSAHTVAAQAAGWSSDDILMIRSGTVELDPALDALLAVAREIATQRGAVSSVTWHHALDAGWTDAELTELFAHVMMIMFTNYFNHYAETDLDWPPMAQPPAEPPGQAASGTDAAGNRRAWMRVRKQSAPGWTGR
jgi:AhpD family alkylhydroperoxidase